MEVVRSKNSVPIRLSQERWFHIVEEHGADETVGKEAKDMGVIEVEKVLSLVPQLLEIPHTRIWTTYDKEADVLYVNFKKPSRDQL